MCNEAKQDAILKRRNAPPIAPSSLPSIVRAHPEIFNNIFHSLFIFSEIHALVIVNFTYNYHF